MISQIGYTIVMEMKNMYAADFYLRIIVQLFFLRHKKLRHYGKNKHALNLP